MLYKAERIKKIVVNKYPNVSLSVCDEEKVEQLEHEFKVPRNQITTDRDFAKLYLSCFYDIIMELDGYYTKRIKMMMCWMDQFTHTLQFEGRKITLKLEDMDMGEICNPEKKRIIRKNNRLLLMNLQLKLDSSCPWFVTEEIK